jgi:hypothetical protein
MKLLIMQFFQTSVEIYFLKYFQLLVVTFGIFLFLIYIIFQNSWREAHMPGLTPSASSQAVRLAGSDLELRGPS